MPVATRGTNARNGRQETAAGELLGEVKGQGRVAEDRRGAVPTESSREAAKSRIVQHGSDDFSNHPVGQAPRGERLRAGIHHDHWKTTTFVSTLTLRGVISSLVLNGPINRIAFEAYVEQVLIPELRPGDIVIMTTSPVTRDRRPFR